MSEEDRVYFERRAEEELALANRATDPAACQVHRALAGHYFERINGARAFEKTSRLMNA